MFPPFLPLYLRIAMGGAAANREMRRMQSEKTQAALQIGTKAAVAMATGQTAAAIAMAAIGAYRKRVGANRRRLTRR